MIWSYLVPSADGSTRRHYGVCVQVYIPGKGHTQVVYQFGTPTQPCAVVHYQSGQIIAPIEEHHRGYPEQRAQAACRERFEGIPRKFAKQENQDAFIARRLDEAPVINTIPRTHGPLKRWPNAEK